MIDPRIFRAYDIRGKAHTQITADACMAIGYAFGSKVAQLYTKQSPLVIVGRDARTHSPEFSEAVKQGLCAAGCTVHDIGQTPSPLNYFTVCTQHADAGVHITASHNPKEDNGIKLCTREADAFSGDDLQDLRLSIEKNSDEHRHASLKNASTSEGIDASTAYVNHLLKIFGKVGEGLRIVVDSGNGVAGPLYCEVLRAVGAEVIELFTEPDGTFPNHAADPSKYSTLRDAQSSVVKHKADCAFAFDGDGDRLGLIDELGGIVTADQVLLLLAQDHLSRFKGAPVIFTVSNSSLLETEVRAWGGRPVMCKVGHSHVEHAMRHERALLGGEQSGHFFCGENYFGFDDALVAGLRVLSILQQQKKAVGIHHTLSCLIREFPPVFQTPEKRPHCSDDAKASVVERITQHYLRSFPVMTLDGARIDFGDGAWAGIRYSNTSPCLSICIEARSEKKLQEVVDEVMSHLSGYAEIGS